MKDSEKQNGKRSTNLICNRRKKIVKCLRPRGQGKDGQMHIMSEVVYEMRSICRRREDLEGVQSVKGGKEEAKVQK